MTDEELLDAYMEGFRDCGKSADRRDQYTGPARIAYGMGWDHFIIGDDVRAVDYLSDEETLTLIRTEVNRQTA
jgi:hypothetical protein